MSIWDKSNACEVHPGYTCTLALTPKTIDKLQRLRYGLGVPLTTVHDTVHLMPKTPVRNVRIPDPLWEKLGKLAQKRNVSITALLIEGANLLLNAGKAPKAIPQGVTVNDETLRRLEALEAEFQALTEHVNATEAQVQTEVQSQVQALEERIQTLEAEVQAQVRLGVQMSEADAEVHLTVQPDVQVETDNADANEVQPTVQAEVQKADVTPSPLTQGELAHRLGLSDKAVEKARRKGTQYFATWSQSRDPEGLAWTWQGMGGRGKPLRYSPKKSRNR